MMPICRVANALVLVAVAGLVLFTFSECCWAASYKLGISQIADNAVGGVTLSCNEKTVCRGPLPLQIGSQAIELSVIATVFAGNAYVRFSQGKKPIPVGSEGYAHIALGTGKLTSTTIRLQPPTDWAYDDVPGSLGHWPVWRSTSPFLAEVRLTVLRLD